jgi:hypothetical protein
MTWEADALVEVEVRKGEWVAARVTEPGTHPRVQTLGGEKNVRPGPGKIRWPKAATSLRRALPPPSSDVAEVEAMERIGPEAYRQVQRVVELRRVPKDPKPFRSREHLRSVASGGCCVPLCYEPAVAHHMENEGGSKKCDDRLTAPLCDHHHLDWWHGKGHLPGLDRTGSLALMWEACARGLAAMLGPKEEER